MFDHDPMIIALRKLEDGVKLEVLPPGTPLIPELEAIREAIEEFRAEPFPKFDPEWN